MSKAIKKKTLSDLEKKALADKLNFEYDSKKGNTPRSITIEIPYDDILITELQKYIKEEVARQLELSLARVDHIKEVSDINTSLKTNLD